jgi:hypothetical protein
MIKFVIGENLLSGGSWSEHRFSGDFVCSGSDSFQVNLLKDFGIWVKIGYETPLGKEVAAIVDGKYSEDSFDQDTALKKAVMKCVIPLLTPEQFTELLDERYSAGFEQGKCFIRNGLKTLLFA